MRYTIFIFLIVIIVGCKSNGYQYIATPHYVPNNTKKGELRGNFNLNNLQAGYSFTDHISVFSGFRYTNHVKDWSNLTEQFYTSEDRNDKSFEFTIGGSYYIHKNNLTYECLAGFGFGKIHYVESHGAINYSFSFDANKMNIILQPDISYTYNKNFEF